MSKQVCFCYNNVWIVSVCDKFMIAIEETLGWSIFFAFVASFGVLL